jgi:cell division protein FtsX
MRLRRLTWAGIAAAVAGFVLVAVAWSVTVGASEPHDQQVAIATFGGAGLATVAVGVALIGWAARRVDAALAEQLDQELAAIDGELEDVA